MNQVGFDSEKYIRLQSEHIRERINQFGGKLYLEFGGKLFDDYHAARVLPGFAPDNKIKMLLALRDQAVPPTINLDNPDEGCDLDFVPHEARQVSGMEYTLCNSFGFGGTNGSLIFKKV